MAIIKKQALVQLSESERNTKIKELKLELIKANVTAKKSNSKTKEIKRTLARLYTFNKTSQKGGSLKK
ncbi:50S ribosomal protein L29 [Candidatus Pacearchaeota archaeon CG10_big_fil_rev_8_21_14_0_10_31_24]|nr:MAG: 50S ribosomal protein L29 [Candidatus Pacearchaeota archaeon CG10_big_fil_rev_8_21_14_0_10_31_24]